MAAELRELARALDGLLEQVSARESTLAHLLAATPAPTRPSARNLAHYLALRSGDLRPLQQQLASLGLSSLGRAENDVAGSLATVRAVLARLLGETMELPSIDFGAASRRLAAHANALLGPASGGRPTRVMVTLPGEAALDPSFADAVIDAGTEMVRINCAHDGPEQWVAMATHARAAAAARGRDVRIQADLAGPKLRTGTVVARRDVVRYRPLRDRFGATVTPARIPLRVRGTSAAGVPISAGLLDTLADGDTLRLRDARGRKREWIIERSGEAVFGLCDRTSYVTPGLQVEASRGRELLALFRLDDELFDLGLPLVAGDRFTLVAEDAPRSARPVHPEVGCLEPAVFAFVRAGERVLFDDGKLAGTIEHAAPERVLVRIDHTRRGGATLRADRGINLPDTALALPLFRERDVAALRAVAAHVDLIGLSFVHAPAEVEHARQLVTEAGRPDLGLVLKIETRHAFEQLPQLLFAALANMPAGVMVARGDLAAEVGFERLAEVQEEILWLCEAAHLPCIWATQVLDQLARTGMPSRAEVTDAAMGARSECVMLNKGPFVVDAVHLLVDVLERMEAHHAKKRSLLRRLAVTADALAEGGDPGP